MPNPSRSPLSRGRGPLPRFPLLILGLLVFSVVSLAGYFAMLTPQINPTPPRGSGDLFPGRLAQTPAPAPTPTAPPTAPPSPPAPPVGGDTVDAHPAAGPPRRFHKLWPPRRWPRDPGSPEQPVEELIYDDARTPDPRGVPMPRHHSAATIDEETGRIFTPDRRRTRQPLIMPAVKHPDLVDRPEERRRDWNIVIGIPTIDTPTGEKRRRFQRASWLRYDNVWNGRNPSATILVKYLLAYHPANNYTLRKSVYDEARENKDIIVFDIKEGNPVPPKGWKKDKKPWAVEVGMSRKAYAWYCYVVDTYRANWVIKGDDDEFLRTKLLEAELNALPFTERAYYGRVMFWGTARGSSLKFPFSGGMSITMTWDLADWIRDSAYAEKGKEYYHEDVMVGRWFYLARVPLNVIRDCRHHDVFSGANKQPVTSRSMCMHHIWEEKEYLEYFRRFPDVNVKASPRQKISKDALGNNYMELSGGCKKG